MIRTHNSVVKKFYFIITFVIYYTWDCFQLNSNSAQSKGVKEQCIVFVSDNFKQELVSLLVGLSGTAFFYI